MEEIIYPRSPREVMDGWTYLPRLVDKIRLQLAGKLHSDYQNNYLKSFDASWFEAAGVEPEVFIEVVRNSITDGQVADWVRKNVKKTEVEKKAHRDWLLNRGKAADAELQERLKQRKAAAGIAHRDDVQTFADLIDADEKRI